MNTTRKNAVGLWWVIRFENAFHVPVYWTGHLMVGSKLTFHDDIRFAAQFETRESAIFQAVLLGLTGDAWDTVQFKWEE